MTLLFTGRRTRKEVDMISREERGGAYPQMDGKGQAARRNKVNKKTKKNITKWSVLFLPAGFDPFAYHQLFFC
jgi:hypothetical protein